MLGPRLKPEPWTKVRPSAQDTTGGTRRQPEQDDCAATGGEVCGGSSGQRRTPRRTSVESLVSIRRRIEPSGLRTCPSPALVAAERARLTAAAMTSAGLAVSDDAEPVRVRQSRHRGIGVNQHALSDRHPRDQTAWVSRLGVVACV